MCIAVRLHFSGSADKKMSALGNQKQTNDGRGWDVR